MNVEENSPVMLGALTMTLINKNDPAYFRHVDGVFTAKHWTAIFIKELDAPRKVPDDVPIEKWGETYTMLIQEKLLQYPMLARICDLYEDYHYSGFRPNEETLCHQTQPSRGFQLLWFLLFRPETAIST
jgi:hypothetical protein